ncbi:MAG: hypothetical protein O7E52_23240, partial [Candidatus Poribacteria bacterium]|nr:hypothetical protein [Candidatus Poribacteria bacterium]
FPAELPLIEFIKFLRRELIIELVCLRIRLWIKLADRLCDRRNKEFGFECLCGRAGLPCPTGIVEPQGNWPSERPTQSGKADGVTGC